MWVFFYVFIMVREIISTIFQIYQRLFQYIDVSTKDVDLPTLFDMISSNKVKL